MWAAAGVSGAWLGLTDSNPRQVLGFTRVAPDCSQLCEEAGVSRGAGNMYQYGVCSRGERGRTNTLATPREASCFALWWCCLKSRGTRRGVCQCFFSLVSV